MDRRKSENFELIKTLICQAPVLRLPNRYGLIKVYVDASRTGVGASIFQTEDAEGKGKENLIGYFSRTLNSAASRYSVSENWNYLKYIMWYPQIEC